MPLTCSPKGSGAGGTAGALGGRRRRASQRPPQAAEQQAGGAHAAAALAAHVVADGQSIVAALGRFCMEAGAAAVCSKQGVRQPAAARPPSRARPAQQVRLGAGRGGCGAQCTANAGPGAVEEARGRAQGGRRTESAGHVDAHAGHGDASDAEAQNLRAGLGRLAEEGGRGVTGWAGALRRAATDGASLRSGAADRTERAVERAAALREAQVSH